MATQILTQERLKSLLDYDPETGVFTWLEKPAKRILVGAIAGTTTSYGYIEIRIFGKRYKAHRLAWLHTYGRFPENGIDHINGVRDDNSLKNLREATSAQNNSNRLLTRELCEVGTSYNPKKRRWQAMIRMSGTSVNLGRFKTQKEANEAYLNARATINSFQPVPRTIDKSYEQ